MNDPLGKGNRIPIFTIAVLLSIYTCIKGASLKLLPLVHWAASFNSDCSREQQDIVLGK